MQMQDCLICHQHFQGLLFPGVWNLNVLEIQADVV